MTILLPCLKQTVILKFPLKYYNKIYLKVTCAFQDDMQQKYEEKISKLRSRFQQEVDIIKMAVTQPQHRQHIYGSAPGLQTR